MFLDGPRIRDNHTQEAGDVELSCHRYRLWMSSDGIKDGNENSCKMQRREALH